MSWYLLALVVAMKLDVRATSFSIKARQSWYVCRSILHFSYLSLADVLQLDAGMYSGRDGIAALPYFDEFDLSTIDVLLISQYVPLSSIERFESMRAPRMDFYRMAVFLEKTRERAGCCTCIETESLLPPQSTYHIVYQSRNQITIQ